MEIEVKKLWALLNDKLDQSLVIHKQNSNDIARLKAQTLLSTMKPIKIFTLIAGILWVLPLGFVLTNLFIHAYDKVSLFFLYSATIQVLLTAIAVVIYIYQLDLIYKIDFSQPVITIQEKLSKIRISTLWIARTLFLQLPLWTTFYLTENTLINGNWLHLLLQGIVTLSFSVVAIWLFIKINYKNSNKRWFRRIFSGKEWIPLMKAIKLLDQVEEYKTKN